MKAEKVLCMIKIKQKAFGKLHSKGIFQKLNKNKIQKRKLKNIKNCNFN